MVQWSNGPIVDSGLSEAEAQLHPKAQRSNNLKARESNTFESEWKFTYRICAEH